MWIRVQLEHPDLRRLSWILSKVMIPLGQEEVEKQQRIARSTKRFRRFRTNDEGDGNKEGASSSGRGADRKKKGRGLGKPHDKMVQAGYGAKAPAVKYKRMERESPGDESDEGKSTTMSKTVEKRGRELGKLCVGKAGYAAKAATKLGIHVASSKYERMERESSGGASDEGMSIPTSKAVRRSNALRRRSSNRISPNWCARPRRKTV